MYKRNCVGNIEVFNVENKYRCDGGCVSCISDYVLNASTAMCDYIGLYNNTNNININNNSNNINNTNNSNSNNSINNNINNTNLTYNSTIN